ncbi:MAG: hypothetical protein IPP89_15410 [Saprospiraceae bacterium]|jgi:hypothetical protein|nr:hypothetical protein [Candidatus Brachybacter algidus]MBL0120327.1 hypothetical protein [Candidatus Brachybacter algidus]
MKTHHLLFIVIAIACNACQKDELIVLPDERDDVTGTYVGFRAPISLLGHSSYYRILLRQLSFFLNRQKIP